MRIFTTALVAAAVISTAWSAPAEAATSTNACRNPVLASSVAWWGTLDKSAAGRVAVTDLPGVSWAFHTVGKRIFMPQLAVTGGQQWKFSAATSGSGTTRIVVDWYTAAGKFLAEQFGPQFKLPGRWTVVSAAFTAPAGAASAHVLQFADTGLRATKCEYQVTELPSDTASSRYGWGTPNPAQSDEYNGNTVDLAKWGLFGAAPGSGTGCMPGFRGHGKRCATQTTESGGFLTVRGTADGVTGGLYSRNRPFRYGRLEVRERAVPLTKVGAQYGAVSLLWPENSKDYKSAEIDFAERKVGEPVINLFVHHDGTQSWCSSKIDSTQFHNYAIDWQPTSVTWYIDAVKICTVNAVVPYFNTANGGAQLDMSPATGPMQVTRQDVDWFRMFPNAYTEYR